MLLSAPSVATIEPRKLFLLPVKMILQWPEKESGSAATTPVSQTSPGARLSQVSSDPCMLPTTIGTSFTVTEAIGDSATLTASQKKPVTSVPENMRGVASVPAWAEPASTRARTGADHNDRKLLIDHSSKFWPPSGERHVSCGGRAPWEGLLDRPLLSYSPATTAVGWSWAFAAVSDTRTSVFRPSSTVTTQWRTRMSCELTSPLPLGFSVSGPDVKIGVPAKSNSATST